MKYISKRKKKKVWKAMECLPSNHGDIWLVLKIIPDLKHLNNRMIIGRETQRFHTGERCLNVGGKYYGITEFDAWAELKKPINFH
ncbi:hypothetical protein [Chryseobacterium caseinilyticum]|uniref:Uncharacterized protein n=1 Tax=Chryseobacterium caseinilyticum TaxID=2771428 RepID=A0ABR8Z758_9FLAO|nr:hypothetical protein [Chryseobacterium caseinilyticum]MBD8081137.1 hypothetical protein [Chryseobacterium caseinilyticum]